MNDGVTVHGASDNTTVSFNEFHGGKNDGHGGVYTYDSTNTHIEQNLIYDYVRSGVMFGVRNGSQNDAPDGGTVTQNTIYNVGHTGISIFQSDVVVDGNTVYGANRYAISVGHNGYEGNNKTVSNVSIINNTVYDNNSTHNDPIGPFRVNMVSNLTVSDNSISGGPGPDSIQGFFGADIFVIRSAMDGVDMVYGFTPGADKLDFSMLALSFDDYDSNRDQLLNDHDTFFSLVNVNGVSSLRFDHPTPEAEATSIILVGVTELAKADAVV